MARHSAVQLTEDEFPFDSETLTALSFQPANTRRTSEPKEIRGKNWETATYRDPAGNLYERETFGNRHYWSLIAERSKNDVAIYTAKPLERKRSRSLDAVFEAYWPLSHSIGAAREQLDIARAETILGTKYTTGVHRVREALMEADRILERIYECVRENRNDDALHKDHHCWEGSFTSLDRTVVENGRWALTVRKDTSDGTHRDETDFVLELSNGCRPVALVGEARIFKREHKYDRWKLDSTFDGGKSLDKKRRNRVERALMSFSARYSDIRPAFKRSRSKPTMVSMGERLLVQ